jgi:hypothetical protein
VKTATFAAALSIALMTSAHAVIVASDNGSNYGSGWTSGSNGGTGFGAWSFIESGLGYKGAFIGNPGNIGVTGMGSSAFALYANPGNVVPAPQIIAARSFNTALGIGDSFSLQWGINWGNGGGSKGLYLYSGTNPISLNSRPTMMPVNQGENPEIQVYNEGATTAAWTNAGFGYGTNAMTWTFTQTTLTSVTVTANDRDGSGSFTATMSVTGPLSGFGLMAHAQYDNNGNREPYYNNFSINAVPAPGAAALIGLAGLITSRRRK